jgi:polyphosphate kinase 2 (PPK2 family)
VEILCWRFKRKERWDDYMSYYEEAINKHLQNMHLVCDSGDDKEMSRYIVAKIIWEEMQNIPISRMGDDIKLILKFIKMY